MLALDLKSPQEVAALYKLIERADIVVQNLAPCALERLGIDFTALRTSNPRLVTCSISGYGAGGPAEGNKAYDLLIQAEAGFLSLTGTPEQVNKAGISIADIAAGVTAYSTILAALLNRVTTGFGDHVEVSMLEAMAEWMGFPMYFALDGAPPPPRTGAAHATIFPYGPFKTADGSVFFGLQNDREWSNFARIVLKLPDLSDDARFRGNFGRANHREVLEPILTSTLSQLTTEEAMARLAKADIATARVNDMAAL
jgi:itaconate CoA-transferase